jgi:hypothetical protein
LDELISSLFLFTQLNREAVEVYFTSDPLAFMNARFISGIALIRRAGKVGP